MTLIKSLHRPRVDQWHRELSRPLAAALGDATKVARLELLCPPNRLVADDVAKYLVLDAGGHRIGVLLCSSPVAPDLVARNVYRASLAKRALGPDLGQVVLDPLFDGQVSGLSCALLPYCRPLSRTRLFHRMQRIALVPRLLTWLRRATQATISTPAAGPDPEIAAALEALARHEMVSSRVRAVARRALNRLETGQWMPRRVLEHGDFWLGNVLIRPTHLAGSPRQCWWNRFAIIDWPGARLDGFAFYDLIRLAMSARIPARRLSSEVEAHCALLGCDRSDAGSYLVTAIGALGLQLEHFPVERYSRMANSCINVLEDCRS